MLFIASVASPRHCKVRDGHVTSPWATPHCTGSVPGRTSANSTLSLKNALHRAAAACCQETGSSEIPRQQFPRSIHVTSSSTSTTRATSSRGCYDATRMSSGDFPVQLATRLPDWSAGCLLRCIVLPVCPCVMSFSIFREHDTPDFCGQVASILV